MMMNLRQAALCLLLIFTSTYVRAEQFQANDVLECDYNYETPQGDDGFCIGTTTTEVKCLDNGHIVTTEKGKYMILLAQSMEGLCGGGGTVEVRKSTLSCADGFCRKIDLP